MFRLISIHSSFIYEDFECELCALSCPPDANKRATNANFIDFMIKEFNVPDPNRTGPTSKIRQSG
jgi:hypothetical protein